SINWTKFGATSQRNRSIFRPPGKGAALSPTWARSAFWPDGALRRHCCKHRWPLLLASVGRAAGGKRPRRPNPLSEEALDAGGCPRLRDEDEEGGRTRRRGTPGGADAATPPAPRTSLRVRSGQASEANIPRRRRGAPGRPKQKATGEGHSGRGRGRRAEGGSAAPPVHGAARRGGGHDATTGRAPPQRERAGAPGRPEPRCRRGYWYVGVTPNSREPAVELLQLCPHGLLDLRRHLRESPVDIGHGDRERRDDFLLVVDVPQVHVLHVLEVDLGLPEQLVDVLARRGLLLLLLRRGALVAAAGGGGPLVPPAVQSEELVAGLLQDLGGLLDQLVHAPDLHVLVLRVLVLHEHAGVGGPLAHEKRQVHLHLGLRVHIQARDLLAHGLQPLPQALHLGVELLRRVRDDLDAVVQAHVPLLLHLRQLGELDADVALLQGLLEPLGVPEELLLADLFVLEVIEDCL
ncbi:unnamed protein product, partial [Prorocentrum cordatum]